MAYGRVASPLKDRLDWLIVGINSGAYGGTVSTRSEAFFNDFVAATGAPIQSTRAGRRCPALSGDLLELFHRGHLTRVRQTAAAGSRDNGVPTWFYAYRITTAGKQAAEAVDGKGGAPLEWNGAVVLDGPAKS
ncbi:hypothetical protein [Caballeronia glathei]|uniref:hypothetical protein n=1 Tax=Caballeronia glathei TaxID=60547 RepID=UPI001050FD0A|nr:MULTISPECIES: hypothetical protein [Burkholderiaceae]TCK33677.1 hypothetical protein B0G84_7974 [Paraburkholderia sp. BL8N3]